MESAAQRLKQLFVARMATQTRKRRKRRVKRESDYKCQKDSAIRYTYLWCSPSVPLPQSATRLPYSRSLRVPRTVDRSCSVGFLHFGAAQCNCGRDEIAVGELDAVCRVVPYRVSEYLASVCYLSNCLLTIINHLHPFYLIHSLNLFYLDNATSQPHKTKQQVSKVTRTAAKISGSI